MANVSLKHIKVCGITTAVPQNSITNNDITEFPIDEIKKICKMTGVQKRRIAPDEICTSDLCINAADDLLTGLSWKKEDIDLLVFVTQTPDHILPATSCIIQNKLGLKTDCISMDINQGCSGYVQGLWTASQLLKSNGIKRALLLVGDTCSKFTSPQDRSTTLLFGDAGTATALEFDESFDQPLFFHIGTDGAGAENLVIPAGSFRNRSNIKTTERLEQKDGNIRSEEDLYMNGGEIFNFTIRAVPGLINSCLELAQTSIEEIDYFVFHQANKFMLKHLIKKAKIPIEKTPFSIEDFGNTSSASIPLTITHNFKNKLEGKLEGKLKGKNQKMALFGFGVGYTWAGAIIPTGCIEYLNQIEMVE